MSLLVWLPLDGDSHNQGLVQLPTPTVNNATYASGGKIGGQSTSGSGKIAWHLTEDILQNEWSVAVWIKATATFNVNNNIIFCKNTSSSSDCQIYFSIVNGTSLHIGVNGPSSSLSTAFTFAVGSWYHVAATYDGNIATLYINGQKKNSTTVTTAWPGEKLNMQLRDRSNNAAGTGSGGSASAAYAMNDFRLYNHALSEKEVEEIAKGLSTHYKLDDPFTESTTNLAGTGFSGWNNSGAATRNTNDTSVPNPPTPGPVGSITITTAGNCAVNMGQTASSGLASKTLTFSTWVWLSSIQDTNVIYIRSVKTDGNVGNFEYEGSTNPNTWPKEKWLHISKTITTASDATAFYFCTYCNTLNQKRAFNGWQVEEKDHSTPWTAPGTTRNASEVIYDVSGYNHHATPIGTITMTSPSPRYGAATHFNGADNCIRVPFNEVCPDNIFTINLWFKKDALGSKGYETLFGGPSGFEMDTRAGNATTLSLYMASIRGATVFSPFNLGEWYMVTMVRDGTNELYYVNGELKKTISAQAMPTGVYRIGAWASDTGQNYYGEISDFRIYNTPLTANNIKELYNTSASIDNNGNIMAREVVE